MAFADAEIAEKATMRCKQLHCALLGCQVASGDPSGPPGPATGRTRQRLKRQTRFSIFADLADFRRFRASGRLQPPRRHTDPADFAEPQRSGKMSLRHRNKRHFASKWCSVDAAARLPPPAAVTRPKNGPEKKVARKNAFLLAKTAVFRPPEPAETGRNRRKSHAPRPKKLEKRRIGRHPPP